MDDPIIMNCKDMEMVQMFVGSALTLGPVPNIEALAEQLEVESYLFEGLRRFLNCSFYWLEVIVAPYNKINISTQ